MAKNVTVQSTPDLISRPSAKFVNEDFSALIHQKGYDCIIESAIKCPCQTKNNSSLSTCANCQGTGWIFINPTSDRAVLSSLNSETVYKEWSEEKLGTVNVTVMKRSQLSFMDKIIILDSSVIQSQVLYPKSFNGHYFAYTIYNIDDVIEVFKFQNATTALVKLEKDVDFTFDRNKIIFSEIPVGDYSVSIRYYHKLQYYVVDIPHVVRNSYRNNSSTGREELQLMPVNAVARLSHYIIEAYNYEGDNYIDNSYQ